MSAWRDVYYSDLQSLWAPLLIPFAFLIYRCVRGAPSGAPAGGRAEAFIAAYTLGWTLETMLDPILGGPVSRALGWSEGIAGTIVVFGFVLLGDLRVFWLVFGLTSSGGTRVGAFLRALRFSLIVPLAAGVVYFAASRLVPDLHSQALWLIYELGFLTMAIWLARVWIPRHVAEDGAGLRGMLRSCLAYVAVYYALWASCDVLIMLGIDEGWALRMLPNQLYYGLWVPFVYARYSELEHRSR